MSVGVGQKVEGGNSPARVPHGSLCGMMYVCVCVGGAVLKVAR